MPASRKGGQRKVKVGVSLDPALHAWAVARVGPGKEFSTLTHAIERGLALLREREAGIEAGEAPRAPRARR